MHKSLNSAISKGDIDEIKKISDDIGKLSSNSDTCPIMMMQYAYTSGGAKVGILWDSASDTNYCTNEMAQRLKLKGDPFTLIISEIAGIKTQIETTRYTCSLKTRFGIITIVMYGIDNIASVSNAAGTGKLVNLFPEFSLKQLERPDTCDILLSQANASLMPSKRSSVGNVVLWDGPIGTVVSGSYKGITESSTNHVQTSSTHLAMSLRAFSESCVIEHQNTVLEFADFDKLHTNVKDFIEFFRYEQIGAACDPKCEPQVDIVGVVIVRLVANS